MPDERVQVAHAAQVDERRGKESAQADVDDQAALDDLDDRTGHDFVGFLLGLDRAPRLLVLRALLREDQAAVLVFLLQDERFDLLAERHDLVRVDVVADRELLGRDDAFGLVSDVEEHLVGVDLHDRSGNEVTVVERDDRRVDRVGERPFEVVDDYLRSLPRTALHSLPASPVSVAAAGAVSSGSPLSAIAPGSWSDTRFPALFWL